LSSYVDGKIIVNNDNLQGMTTKQSNAMTLTSGLHPLRVEYFNAEGPGGVVVEWQGPGTSKSVIPSSAFSSQASAPRGLNAKFYSTPSLLSKLPQFPVGKDFPLLKDTTVASLNYPDTNSFADLGLNKRFIGLFSGFISIPSSGKWSFFSESDDGSKVYIDNILLIDNDGTHGMFEKSNSVDLGAGSHTIRVEFFNGDGPGGLVLRWSGPSVPKQLIPPSALFTSSTSGANQCYLFSSYDENSLSSQENLSPAHETASSYILVRAKVYPQCDFSGNGRSVLHN
jgi:hypothetical protein